MSDRNQNRKTRLSDFLRYHNNEMTGEERNSFERDLQKDAFSEEASEGLASLSDEEFSEDIGKLRKLLKNKTGRKKRHAVYRIAASVAVLMTISSVFLIVERNKTGQQVSEKIAGSQTLEIPAPQPLTAPFADNTSAISKDEIPKTSSFSVSRKRSTPSGEANVQEPERDKKNTESEKLISSDNSNIEKPLASEKKEEVKADVDSKSRSFVAIASRANIIDTPGVSMAAGQAEKREYALDEEALSDQSAQPVDGMPAFNKYIRDNQIRPDSITSGQRVVVVVRFMVLTDGSLDSLKVLRSPGKVFSDEAIRLVRSGPKWKPGIKNGKPAEESVEVKIVFR